MDLKMEVYTPSLELVGLLEIQRSVIWEEKAFSAGSFSVESLITDESRELLVPDNIIWIEGSTAGIIEYINQESDETGPYISVKGRTLTGILDWHVLYGRYNMSGTVPEIMRRLVDDCCVHPTRGNIEARKIPGLVLADAPAGGASIRVQKTGGSLLEALEELGEAYQVAFGVRFNPAVPQMEFWTNPGVNRSVGQDVNEPVFYSTELDDVLSSEYSYDSGDYRNVAYVAGEGEGDDRVVITVEGPIEPAPKPPTPPEPVMHTITLSVDPEGGGTASGGGSAEDGGTITVTASPSNGHEFVGWRENGSIVSSSASYTFTVTGDRSLTAVFVAVVPVYVVSVAVDPAGGGTVSGGGSYEQGKSVTLTQTAASGYRFTGWYNASGALLSTNSTYTFTPASNISVTAKYAVIPVYTITTSIDPAGGGTATGGGTYQEGASVTVTASAADGYSFTAWKENGTTVSTSASYTFTANGNRTLTAGFAAIPAGRLPAGYTEVEYVQNGTSGTTSRMPYIQMPAKSTATKFSLKFSSGQTSSTSSATVYAVYGYGQKSGTSIYREGICVCSGKVRFRHQTSFTNLADYVAGSNYEIELDSTAKTITTNGTTISKTVGTYWRSSMNRLFGEQQNNLNDESQAKQTKVYSLKMWDTNGNLVLDFVPCIDPSGAIGMYDAVGEKFYGNSNTSTSSYNIFIAGPAVS